MIGARKDPINRPEENLKVIEAGIVVRPYTFITGNQCQFFLFPSMNKIEGWIFAIIMVSPC